MSQILRNFLNLHRKDLVLVCLTSLHTYLNQLHLSPLIIPVQFPHACGQQMHLYPKCSCFVHFRCCRMDVDVLGAHRASKPPHLLDQTRINFPLQLRWSTDCGVNKYSYFEDLYQSSLCCCKQAMHCRTTEVSVEQLCQPSNHSRSSSFAHRCSSHLSCMANVTGSVSFKCSVADGIEASYRSQNSCTV